MSEINEHEHEKEWQYFDKTYGELSYISIEKALLNNDKNIALLNIRHHNSFISRLAKEIISGNKIYYENI
jgi:hypothetical protein